MKVSQARKKIFTRRRVLPVLLCIYLLPLFAQKNGSSSLSSRLDTLIKQMLPVGSNVGIAVYDLTDGRPLYEYQADMLSRPASTMKLLTAITALARPEADEPFRTEVWYKGTVARDTLQGDLYIIGGYDPEFDDSALDSLANAVARLPFSVIHGRVYGDISMKDSLYWGSGWAWDDTPEAYQPYLSPLMLNKGTVTVTATPGGRGEAARLSCIPASSYYTLGNLTKSQTPSAGRFRVSRNWLENGNRIVVTGNVDGRRTGIVNIYSSQDFFMHTFMERLLARGIRCIPPEGRIPSSGYAFGEFLKDTLSVQAAVYETPVQHVVDGIMKESDNLSAEALLCRLGAQYTGRKRVSAEDGLSAIRMLIKQLGHNPDDYKLADGCGLSNYNYISPNLLVAFLRYAHSRTDIFRKLYKALPVGGVDGTLKNRMKKGTLSHRNVRAKTGSFTAINCLAGYAEAADGHEIAFAIMNQNALSGREARAFQDAVCEEIRRCSTFSLP